MNPKLSALFAAAAGGLAVLASPVAAGDNPFAALVGTWSGSGNVKLENGGTEKLKCKGYYTSKSGGSELGMAINCGNASFKINMRANLTYANGRVSGTWEEREFNQSGNVNGKAASDKLTLAFSGPIAGSMSVSMSGNAQTVSISTGGPGFTGVNLQFAKSG